MANITYPQFGKVKTIVLPIDFYKDYTLDEYKEKYGIDLRDFIELKDNVIWFKPPKNSLILIDDEHAREYGYALSPIIFIDQVPYESGVNGGVLHLNIETNLAYGISIKIDSDKEFSIDNVYIVETDF